MNLINNLRGGHCFGSSRTRRNTGGKTTMFKLDHAVFDGGIRWCMFPLCFCQNCVNFLRRLALQEKKILITARVSMLVKLRVSPDMFPFSLCNKKRLAIRHMNRPLFPTTLSIPSYDIGNYAGLRTYQQPSYLTHHRNKGVTTQNTSAHFIHRDQNHMLKIYYTDSKISQMSST